MRSSFLALVVASLLASCSSTSPGSAPDSGAAGGDSGTADASSSGSSEGSVVAPDAFIAATVGPGTAGSPIACSVGVVHAWLDVGTPVAGKPTTVTDGGEQSGAPVHVACTVSPSGTGFDVSLRLTEDGASGGSVTITSPAGAGAVTAAGGQGITGVFQSAAQGNYSENDCTLAFTYQGLPVPDQPHIAAGRIWGHLSCPAAQLSGQTGPCDVEADVLFEQCGL